jgi:glycosyltransferase involved in cell wall biosynthesis
LSNSSLHVEKTIDKVIEIVEGVSIISEILVISDGSTDDTLKVRFKEGFTERIKMYCDIIKYIRM